MNIERKIIMKESIYRASVVLGLFIVVLLLAVMYPVENKTTVGVYQDRVLPLSLRALGLQ